MPVAVLIATEDGWMPTFTVPVLEGADEGWMATLATAGLTVAPDTLLVTVTGASPGVLLPGKATCSRFAESMLAGCPSKFAVTVGVPGVP